MIFFAKPVSTFADHAPNSRAAIGAVGAAMDDFFYMLLLAALAIPVIAIAALVVALSQFSAIRRLDERLRALEFARAQGRHRGGANRRRSTASINHACAGDKARVDDANETAPAPATEAAEVPASATPESPAARRRCRLASTVGAARRRGLAPAAAFDRL